MAPRRSTPLEDPPSASSPEDEVESSSREEVDDEEDEEEKVKDGDAQESESDSEAVSAGSESDSFFVRTNPNVNPMEDKTQKPKPKPNTATLKPVAAAKRVAETGGAAKDTKRVKKDAEAGGAATGEKLEDEKKLFQRLWSEEDEIAVLNGMIEFTGKKGVDPSKDMVAFHDFIKKDFIKVQLAQVKDKVRRLKKKFKNNVKKGKKGEERTFSNDHDQEVFELSKKIWGSGGTSGKGSDVDPESVVKSNIMGRGIGYKLAGLKVDLGSVWDRTEGEEGAKIGKNVDFEVEKLASFEKIGWSVAMEEYVLQKGMELLDGSKKDEMEDRLQKLLIGDLELSVKRNKLVRELAELVLAACNKRDED